MEELDRDHPHLERVAWLGALDEDRPGHRMSARSALGDAALDGLQGFGNLSFGGAGQPQPLQAAGDHRLDAHGSPEAMRSTGGTRES